MTVTLPPGRKDLTQEFLATASDGQIASVRARAEELARNYGHMYSGEFGIYAMYDTGIPGRQKTIPEEAPLRKRIWMGKFNAEGYGGGAHFVIDSTQYEGEGYVSLFHQKAPSYDYGHELYSTQAPVDYRERLNAENAIIEAREAALYDDEDDDEDYEDIDDTF